MKTYKLNEVLERTKEFNNSMDNGPAYVDLEDGYSEIVVMSKDYFKRVADAIQRMPANLKRRL